MKWLCFIFYIGLYFSITNLSYTASDEYDAMGGWKHVSAEAKLYFYARHIDGVWWFVNPAGNGFISKGVNRVSYSGEHAPKLGYSPYHRYIIDRFNLPADWAKDTVQRLSKWNLNTIGAWSTGSLFKQGMPYTVMLDISKKAGGDLSRGMFPDVFDPSFERAVRYEAAQQCKPRNNDYFLLGYFLDTGFQAGEDWQDNITILVDFTKLPDNSSGKNEAMSFIRERYANIVELNQAWGCNLESYHQIPILHLPNRTPTRNQDETDFFQTVLEKYFKTCHDAIRSLDPNHLILSPRFSGHIPDPVLPSMKQYVDVISYNHYGGTPPRKELYRIYQQTQKPVMLTEFSFRAFDSGLPNQNGKGIPVETQQDRAKKYSSFVNDVMRIPFIIGYHWHQYADQPKEGNKYNQSNNYGLVNVQNHAWDILTKEITKTNANIERIHAGLR